MSYYIVKNKQTGAEQLVEADIKTQAFRLVAESLIEVEVAKPERLVKMLEDGAVVLPKIEPQINLPLPE